MRADSNKRQKMTKSEKSFFVNRRKNGNGNN